MPTIETPYIPLPPTAISASDDGEAQITEQITVLWKCHTEVHSTVSRSREELAKIRSQLGERLYEMKQILARPGRAGQWSNFLVSHSIPRATADRLVTRYRHSIGDSANCLNEAITNPTDEQIQRRVGAVWSRVAKKLLTPQAIFQFIAGMIATSGLAFEPREDGVMVFAPAQVKEEEPEATPIPDDALEVATPTTDFPD